MENNNHKSQFENSTYDFIQAWKSIEEFDHSTENRKLSMFETVEGCVKLSDFLLKMLIVFRDGEKWQNNGRQEPLLVTYSSEINELIRRNQGTVIIYHSSQNH